MCSRDSRKMERLSMTAAAPTIVATVMDFALIDFSSFALLRILQNSREHICCYTDRRASPQKVHSTTWRKQSQTGLKTKKVLRQELQLSKQSPAARGRGQGGKTGQILIAARFIRNRRISEPHCT